MPKKPVNCDLCEAGQYIAMQNEDLAICEKERYYLEAFISSKGLYAEYQYFKETAREVYEEGLPFPVIKL